MKIEIKEINNLWQGINLIYSENEKVNGVFDYFMQKQNIPILQKEVEKLQGVDPEIYEQLKNNTIDLPLQRIKPDLLPDTVQKGVVMLLDAIIESEFNLDGYGGSEDLDALIEGVTESQEFAENEEATEIVPEE